MRNLLLAGTLLLSSLSLEIGAVEHYAARHHPHDHHYFKDVSTEKLKKWYDLEVEMTVIDTRSSQYFNGILMPDAIWVPFDASWYDVKQALPSKDALIVVYCLDSNCPMSTWMAERLVDHGYRRVYKYSEGLKVWIKHGYWTAED